MLFCTELTFDLILRLRSIFRLGIHPYVFYHTSRSTMSMDAIMYSILPPEEFFQAMDCWLLKHIQDRYGTTKMTGQTRWNMKSILRPSNLQRTVLKNIVEETGTHCHNWENVLKYAPIVHRWPNRLSVTKPFIWYQTIQLRPNLSLVTKPFIRDQFHPWSNFTCDQTVHPWPNLSPVIKKVHPWHDISLMTKPFIYDQTVHP